MYPVFFRRSALTAAALATGTLMIFLLLGSLLPARATPIFGVSQPESPGQRVQKMAVAFPADISCTELTVEHIAQYCGTFYEDGSTREVFQTAAAVVANRGDTVIPYAQITMHTQTQTYVFEGFLLPPQSVTIIPERSGKGYPEEPVIALFGWHTDAPEDGCGGIRVTEPDMGTLRVENQTEDTLAGLVLYHKMYLPGDDVYVGGVAFSTIVPTLAPGEAVTVHPRCYAAGYSRILFVRKLS